MKALGLFGLNVPEEYGGSEVDYTTFAMIFEELSRGWMGLAGVLGTHLVLCDVLVRFGTEEQKRRFLPGLATGERRGGICLSEPNAGTDLQAITTTARRATATSYVVNGSKMWVTNGRRGKSFLLLAKTDPAAKPRASRHERVRHRKGRAGPDREPRHRQAGLQERRDLRAALRGFSGAGREPDRRRGRPGIQAGDDRPRSRAAQRRRARPGRRAGGVRRSDPLRAAAAHLRQADRASTRRFRSSWPTWRRGSKRRGC